MQRTPFALIRQYLDTAGENAEKTFLFLTDLERQNLSIPPNTYSPLIFIVQEEPNISFTGKVWYYYNGWNDLASGGGGGGPVNWGSILGSLSSQTDLENALNAKQPLGAFNLIGVWNASLNTPTIPAANSSNKGNVYIVSVAGNSNIAGITEWQVDDLLYSTGVTWKKISATSYQSYFTRLDITAPLNAGAILRTNTSGVGFTKSFENTYLGSTIGAYNSNPKVKISRNGVVVSRSLINYITDVQFSFSFVLDIGEEVTIESNLTI